MPRLRVLAGESPESLKPISANSPSGYKLKTPGFEGEISVFLKNYINEQGELSSDDYFDHPEHESRTWSIQARGAVCLTSRHSTSKKAQLIRIHLLGRPILEEIERRQCTIWQQL